MDKPVLVFAFCILHFALGFQEKEKGEKQEE